MELVRILLGSVGARMIVGLIGVIALVAVNALFLIWMERKVSAHMQLRPGPMEVGPHGAIQTVADALKLMGKELITPEEVDKPIYLAGPHRHLLAGAALLPGDPLFQDLDHPGHERGDPPDPGLCDAGGAGHPHGRLGLQQQVLGAWGHPLRGPERRLRDPAAHYAHEHHPHGGILQASRHRRGPGQLWFVLIQPLAFILYITCATAETNRAPFDLPEAESELVAGFHTEYSGMRFALFFLAEYTNMFIVAAIATVFFLGGWHGPVLPGIVWFFIKVYSVIFLLMWFRWTFPRVRFDQLVTFAWKILIPLAFANLLITAFIMKL